MQRLCKGQKHAAQEHQLYPVALGSGEQRPARRQRVSSIASILLVNPVPFWDRKSRTGARTWRSRGEPWDATTHMRSPRRLIAPSMRRRCLEVARRGEVVLTASATYQRDFIS